MHPIAFVESLDALDWGMWRADDPDTHAEAVERMTGVIRRWASNITTIHCDPHDDTCGAPQTINVADLPVDDGSYHYPYCDHRPQYHLGINGPDPVQHNSYNGPFYGVVDESQSGEEHLGDGLERRVPRLLEQATRTSPRTTRSRRTRAPSILDHRLGNGGDVLGATYLTSLWRASARSRRSRRST